jgi:hypothetical protein
MTAKNTRASDLVRYSSLDDLRPAPPLSKAVKAMSDAEVARRAAADPDAGSIPDGFWDTVQVVEPEGTDTSPCACRAACWGTSRPRARATRRG